MREEGTARNVKQTATAKDFARDDEFEPRGRQADAGDIWIAPRRALARALEAVDRATWSSRVQASGSGLRGRPAAVGA